MKPIWVAVLILWVVFSSLVSAAIVIESQPKPVPYCPPDPSDCD